MAIALLAVQAAIVQKLKADAPLAAKVTGVFDFVPQDQAHPFVHVADQTQNRFDTFGRDGADTTLTLHVLSSYQGAKEALEIAALVNDVLDHQPLAVAGFDTVAIHFENLMTQPEADGLSRRVSIRYRIIVQEGE